MTNTMCENMVSVIVPVYNSEKHIEKCIKSIQNQTYKELEILIIDDGSKDMSLDICKKLSDEDPRIKIFKKENGGVSTARNLGINASSGRFISFVDSDDWIESNLFEVCIREMIANRCQAAMFEYYIDFTDKSIIHSHSGYGSYISGKDALKATISPVNRFAWSKIFERSIIGDVRFNENIYVGEDTLFSCNVLKKAEKVYFSDIPFYHYLQNTESATGSGYNEKFMTAVRAYEEICSLAVFDKELYIVAKNAYCIFLVNNIVGLKNKYENLYRDKRKEFIKNLRNSMFKILISNVSFKDKFKICICSLLPDIYSKYIGGRNR